MNRLGRKRKKSVVTIIVGIICKDGIAISSDSQTTAGTSKRTDTDKISLVQFSSVNKLAAIAQGGDYSLSSYTVEVFQRLALTCSFDDYRKPADLLQDAVCEAKKHLVRLNNWEDRRDLEQEYLYDNPFSFLLAYYFNSKPYLYTLESVPGFARLERNYACVGCGSTVAEFILSRATPFAEWQVMKGAAAAVYTVEQVKTVDAACGGATKAAVVFPNSKISFSSAGSDIQKMIDKLARVLSKLDGQLKSQWIAMLESVWNEVTGGNENA